MADDADIAEERVEKVVADRVATIAASLATPGAAACEVCGDEIPEERRRALPSARTCIDCQTRMERRR